MRKQGESEKVISEFLTFLKIEKQYSQLTLDNYQQKLMFFQEFIDANQITEKNFSVLNVDLLILKNFVFELHKNHFKISTIRNYISTLKSFYSFCIFKDYLKTSPAKHLDYPKEEKRLPKIMYTDEFKNFMRTIKEAEKFSRRNKALFFLLYSTGIRVSEITNIKINDLDFEQMSLLVHGKGQKQRLIPLNQEVILLLKNYMMIDRDGQLKDKETEFLFISNKGTPLTTRGIRHVTTTITQKSAMILNVTPHKFRHTLATNLLNQGMDLRYVQEILGHEHLNTTEIYTQISTKQMKNKYEKLIRR